MYDINGYFEARTLADAFEQLENANAQIISGGTDVLIRTRERANGYFGRDLVGITRIPGIKDITVTDTGIEIGACCTFSAIENSTVVREYLPLLAMAAASVGGPQVRNLGTIGGNVVNGAPSADTAPALFCYNAVLRLESKNGVVETPITEFYVGPGRVNIEQGQILTAIKISKADYMDYSGHYIKFSRRNAMDIATLGCAALVRMEDGAIDDLRLAYSVAGPTPLRAYEAEKFAAGIKPTAENLQMLGEKALQSCKARDSWRASKAYRERLIVELAQRAIAAATGEVCVYESRQEEQPEAEHCRHTKSAIKAGDNDEA